MKGIENTHNNSSGMMWKQDESRRDCWATSTFFCFSNLYKVGKIETSIVVAGHFVLIYYTALKLKSKLYFENN